MTDKEREKAITIFASAANKWSNDDKVFLDGLFKRGLRRELKNLMENK